MQIAKFFLFGDQEDISPVQEIGQPMPFTYVNMYPGFYTLGGETWDCTRAGLYRFKVEGEPFFRNRIVQGNAPFDVFAILSSLCWNHVHGGADESTWNLQAVADRGRYVVWRMRCGYICNFVEWLLPQYGYTVRQVGVMTNESPNGYDDGHAVIELWHDGKWKMFDMTMGCWWRGADGTHLDVQEFIDHIAGGSPMPERMPLDGKQRRWDYETIPGGTFDMGLYGEFLLSSPAQEEAWFRRIFQRKL
jgi:hypothetical protein